MKTVILGFSSKTLYSKTKGGKVSKHKLTARIKKTGGCSLTIKTTNILKSGKNGVSKAPKKILFSSPSKLKLYIDKLYNKGWVDKKSKLNAPPSFKNGIFMPMLVTPIDVENDSDLKNSVVANELLKKRGSLISQGKLDGNRAIYSYKTHQLCSRGGHTVNLPHILNDLAKVPDLDVDLDGEIILPGEPLGSLTSAIATKDPRIIFCPFDVMTDRADFHTRRNKLRSLDFSMCFFIRPMIGVEVRSMDELIAAHQFFTEEYGEGSILRDPDAWYDFDSRSNGVYKIKRRNDREYLCVGHYLTPNTKRVNLIMKTPQGDEFHLPVANYDDMRDSLENRFGSEWLNQPITVSYTSLTKNGKPREGKAIRPRHYLS